MRKMMAPGVPASHAAPTSPQDELLKRLFSRIHEVSSLPAVALKVIEIANDSSTEAEDLLIAIRFDPAMAARIMRTVNSAYYGLPNRVGDLKLAISLLGFDEIRNLAMTAYVAQMFRGSVGYGTYSREKLWNHMIGTAMVARLVAGITRCALPREAYLAGLLHDLGIILIDQYLHAPFCKVIDSLQVNGDQCNLEREALGFDHAELGAFVAERWRLPDHLVAAIRYHHRPLDYEGAHANVVNAVTLANFLCHARNLSSLGVQVACAPSEEVFNATGVNREVLQEIWDQLDDTLAAADIFSLTRQEAVKEA